MSRNPYHQPRKQPTLRPSVFAWIDILGYMELIRQPKSRRGQQALLRRLHKTLTKARENLEDKHPAVQDFKKWVLKDRYALKAYTDNITIGWPILRDAESECGEALQKLCEFQFRMTVAGFFIRGALSVGDAYVDEIAVFGKALDEAYQGETTLARDPRIIITASTKTAMKRHINYYASPEGSPQVFYVLRDSDGQWFINYLAYVLWLEEEVGPLYEEMMQHKRAVELKLDEHKKQPAIWSKYAWVARYHNFFCDRYSHHFDDTFKIDLNLFTSQPARIIDEG